MASMQVSSLRRGWASASFCPEGVDPALRWAREGAEECRAAVGTWKSAEGLVTVGGAALLVRSPASPSPRWFVADAATRRQLCGQAGAGREQRCPPALTPPPAHTEGERLPLGEGRLRGQPSPAQPSPGEPTCLLGAGGARRSLGPAGVRGGPRQVGLVPGRSRCRGGAWLLPRRGLGLRLPGWLAVAVGRDAQRPACCDRSVRTSVAWSVSGKDSRFGAFN